MDDRIVLDASALLCLLGDGRGADRVAAVLTRSVIGAANLAEAVATLRGHGLSLDEVHEALGGLDLDVRSLSTAQAMTIGDLHAVGGASGLSLGDRACLALAIELDAAIYTTNPALARAVVAVVVTDIRG